MCEMNVTSVGASFCSSVRPKERRRTWRRSTAVVPVWESVYVLCSNEYSDCLFLTYKYCRDSVKELVDIRSYYDCHWKYNNLLSTRQRRKFVYYKRHSKSSSFWTYIIALNLIITSDVVTVTPQCGVIVIYLSDAGVILQWRSSNRSPNGSNSSLLCTYHLLLGSLQKWRDKIMWDATRLRNLDLAWERMWTSECRGGTSRMLNKSRYYFDIPPLLPRVEPGERKVGSGDIPYVCQVSSSPSSDKSNRG